MTPREPITVGSPPSLRRGLGANAAARSSVPGAVPRHSVTADNDETDVLSLELRQRGAQGELRLLHVVKEEFERRIEVVEAGLAGALAMKPSLKRLPSLRIGRVVQTPGRRRDAHHLLERRR